jgi:hypothetical protein
MGSTGKCSVVERLGRGNAEVVRRWCLGALSMSCFGSETALDKESGRWSQRKRKAVSE